MTRARKLGRLSPIMVLLAQGQLGTHLAVFFFFYIQVANALGPGLGSWLSSFAGVLVGAVV